MQGKGVTACLAGWGLLLLLHEGKQTSTILPLQDWKESRGSLLLASEARALYSWDPARHLLAASFIMYHGCSACSVRSLLCMMQHSSRKTCRDCLPWHARFSCHGCSACSVYTSCWCCRLTVTLHQPQRVAQSVVALVVWPCRAISSSLSPCGITCHNPGRACVLLQQVCACCQCRVVDSSVGFAQRLPTYVAFLRLAL
jgi:hypothetical protein